MMTVEKIKRSYDRYAKEYDMGTDLQRRLADKLIEAIRHDCVNSAKILDVGCGTGYLTSRLNAIGCDISFGMLSCAKRKGFYAQSNAMQLAFADEKFDLVVSNAAYQWVNVLPAAFKETRRVLKPKGMFYFVVFGKNTLRELQSVSTEIKVASSNFPGKKSLSVALSAAGFKTNSIETFIYEKYYKDLWQLLAVLKNIGSTAAENKNITGLGWRKKLKQINKLYLEKFGNDKGLPATYEAFLIRAEK